MDMLLNSRQYKNNEEKIHITTKIDAQWTKFANSQVAVQAKQSIVYDISKLQAELTIFKPHRAPKGCYEKNIKKYRNKFKR